MDRLTERNKYKAAYYPYCFKENTCDGKGTSKKCDYCEFSTMVCERIAEYEDTGLTPEQILAMDEEYKKLAKEIGEYKRLEEQGRLIKLPFAFGQAIYWITTKCDAGLEPEGACDKYVCDECPYCNELTVAKGTAQAYHVVRFLEEKLVREYYLTQEEAEKALEEMEK